MKSHNNARLTRHDKDKDFDVITSPVIKTATVAFLYCNTVKIGSLLALPPTMRRCFGCAHEDENFVRRICELLTY